MISQFSSALSRRLLVGLTLLLAISVAIPGVLAQGNSAGNSNRPDRVSNALLNLVGQGQTTERLNVTLASQAAANADLPLRLTDGGTSVVVDAIASGDPQALLADLNAIGLYRGSVYGRVVSGRLPVSSIGALSDIPSLTYIAPAFAETNAADVGAGSIINEAVFSQLVDVVVERYDIRGEGMTVGILSDSFSCGQDSVPNGGTLAADIESGDLPPLDRINIISDYFEPGCIDEGRAMAQLVYDIVPEADIAFYSAFNGQADFANGIIALADAGADVIVDDIIYFAEPMFADGIIGQAADEVTARGIPYFSSAGNRAERSYESVFRPVFSEDFGAIFHDFNPEPSDGTLECTGPGRANPNNPNVVCVDPSVDIFQDVTLQPGQTFIPSTQWVDAYASTNPASPGAQTDLDIAFFLDGELLFGSFADNIGGDPTEITGIINNGTEPLTVQFAIIYFSGPVPELVKYVNFGPSSVTPEYGLGALTSFGHNNSGGRTGNAAADPEAIGAIGVAAAFWGTTPAYANFPFYAGEPQVNGFSSYGGIFTYYDEFGNRYPQPILNMTPEVTGVDGSSNTFFFSDGTGDGVPNFFGTSAGAPNVAAVAALMLQVDPNLTSLDILEILQATALDIQSTSRFFGPAVNRNVVLAEGFDFASGAGLVQADEAVRLVLSSPATCNGLAATIYVEEGYIVGGPDDGDMYLGTLNGTDGVDVISGTNINDTINGGDEDDVICGYNGVDLVRAGKGNDIVFGGNDNDDLRGDRGQDQLFGEGGADALDGGRSNDFLDGGDGTDYCVAAPSDTLVNCE